MNLRKDHYRSLPLPLSSCEASRGRVCVVRSPLGVRSVCRVLPRSPCACILGVRSLTRVGVTFPPLPCNPLRRAARRVGSPTTLLVRSPHGARSCGACRGAPSLSVRRDVCAEETCVLFGISWRRLSPCLESRRLVRVWRLLCCYRMALVACGVLDLANASNSHNSCRWISWLSQR